MLTVNDIRENANYKDLLKRIGALSNLFSDSNVPFLHYRVAENLFCRCFDAKNLARDDTAYDSLYQGVGVGIKTFLMPQNKSFQKVAEFDELSSSLSTDMTELEVAKQVAHWRNERIKYANGLYGIASIADACYHIIARRKESFLLFNTAYDFINLDSVVLRDSDKNSKSITFSDGKNLYRFYKSKSTLFEEFLLPPQDDVISLPISILEDPFSALLDLQLSQVELKQREYVVLPLYSTKLKGEVAPSSGLNQWNAKGRIRDCNEVYIPIPASVHEKLPNFFPPRENEFTLILPDETKLKAKICQEGGKALMSNPNKALGKWLLRQVFNLHEGELLTRAHLSLYGVDSIVIEKESELVYRAIVTSQHHYENDDESEMNTLE